MPYTSGVFDLPQGQHRLFQTMETITFLFASVSVALEHMKGHTVKIERNETQIFKSSSAFKVDLRLPLHLVFDTILANESPAGIRVEFPLKRDYNVGPWTTAPIFPRLTRLTIAPLFTDYFETYRPWLEAQVSSDPWQWPNIWNFARVVRNAASHGGRVNIDKPTTPTVHWQHLTYGPNENGQQIFGTDLSLADIVILMFDMDSVLDALSCPIL